MSSLPEKLFGKKKVKIILDTNILLLPGSRGFDVFTALDSLLQEPFQVCIMDQSFRELKAIADGTTKSKGKDKFNAKLGFILAKQKGLKSLLTSSKESLVDDQLVAQAKEGVYIVTLDKHLQKRIVAKGEKVITLGQGKSFQFLK